MSSDTTLPDSRTEYYTSEVAYETGGAYHPEPWEPNVTALHDPESLKWGDLVEPGTPLPTSWDKDAFEAESAAAQVRRRDLRLEGAPEPEIDRLFTEQMERETAFLGSMEYAGAVGAFEGASYEPVGLYRFRDRLHHAHPQSSGVLPGVSARDQSSD